MSELYISWDEYHQAIELLAAKINRSQANFNQIICLARGGLRVGDILSRIFHQPLAILATSSYHDETCKRGKLSIANHLTMTADRLGDRVLLVDDLVDSGITLQQTILWLRDRYPEITTIETAVIWYKDCSIWIPDYSDPK